MAKEEEFQFALQQERAFEHQQHRQARELLLEQEFSQQRQKKQDVAQFWAQHLKARMTQEEEAQLEGLKEQAQLQARHAQQEQQQQREAQQQLRQQESHQPSGRQVV